MRIATTFIALASLALTACPPAEDPKTGGSSGGSSSGGSSSGGSSSGGSSSGGSAKCEGKPAVGKKAPALSIDSMNGAGKAAITPGKVTLVDFWATWCEPCKKSFPKYQELYVKYKASGLEIIAVSVDDEKNEVASFAKNYGAKFPVGWDDGHKHAGCWSPPGMPSAFIIDKQGNVKHVHQGWHDGEEKEVEKEIKALL